jgi:hypothetical protein
VGAASCARKAAEMASMKPKNLFLTSNRTSHLR